MFLFENRLLFDFLDISYFELLIDSERTINKINKLDAIKI
jgi:hypothetical protein